VGQRAKLAPRQPGLELVGEQVIHRIVVAHETLPRQSVLLRQIQQKFPAAMPVAAAQGK
jgi:hypothetical protein